MDSQLTRLNAYLQQIPDLEARYRTLINKALHYVIDRENTGREHFHEVSKVEKTIVGMKIEKYAEHAFGWERGVKLDHYIAELETEFDSKVTIGSNWMIPREAVGEICLLIRVDVSRRRFHVGLIRADEAHLTSGSNQDKKRSISALGKQQIEWLIESATLIPPQ